MHLSGPAPEPPDVMSVEITTRCNLKCKMCALVTGGTRSSQVAGHMEENLWPRILEAARQVGHVNVNGWGENFYHPGFLGFLEDLDRLGVSTNFSTNGTFVTPEVVARLAQLRRLKHINVSIDSPDPEIFQAIRGGNLAAALRGLSALTAGLPRPERITVSSVVMESNFRSLRAFPRLLARHGVRSYVMQGMVDAGENLPAERLLPRPEVVEAVEEVRRNCELWDIDVLVSPYLRHQAEGSEPSVWGQVAPNLRQAEEDAPGVPTRQCSSPWDHVFVNKDGLVLPCCNCPPWEQAAADGQGVMGDLKQQSFLEIWHGERFQRFREQLLQGPMPSICQTCNVTSTGSHHLRLFAARVLSSRSSCRGAKVRLVVENAGAAPWTRASLVRVGTAAPRDRESDLKHRSWLSRNRPSTFEEERVLPGSRATFRFLVARDLWTGPEAFQLVVEDVGWLPGTRFELHPPDRAGRFARGARVVQRWESPGRGSAVQAAR